MMSAISGVRVAVYTATAAVSATSPVTLALMPPGGRSSKDDNDTLHFVVCLCFAFVCVRLVCACAAILPASFVRFALAAVSTTAALCFAAKLFDVL
jgi:hypothetical protein